jgi:hypothetical protein
VGLPELNTRIKELVQPFDELQLDGAEAWQARAHHAQHVVLHDERVQSLLVGVELPEGLAVLVEAFQQKRLARLGAQRETPEPGAPPLLRQVCGAFQRVALGHLPGLDAALGGGALCEQLEVVIARMRTLPADGSVLVSPKEELTNQTARHENKIRPISVFPGSHPKLIAAPGSLWFCSGEKEFSEKARAPRAQITTYFIALLSLRPVLN